MFKKILFTGALLATFATAYAQSSAPFGVSGTVTPGPCNVTMSGGSTANLGSISTTTVKGWSTTNDSNLAYNSPLINLPFSITCSAATKIGVSMVDNNSGKVLAQNSWDAVRFGLVNGAGTSSIGSFKFYFTGILIDGSNVWSALSAPTGSTTWTTTSAAGTTLFPYYAAPGYTNAFSKTNGGTTPDAFTTLSGNLAVTVQLGKTIIDTATTAITPNGSGTLTLVYL